MPEENQFTERESLQLINRMIYEAKGYYYESGIGGLVYGFSVLICSLLTYFVEKEILYFPFHPFYLLIPVFFVQGWIQYKEEQKKKAKTFTDEAIDYVWIGFFASALAAFCGSFAGLNYVIITIVLFLLGFATFLTGLLAKFRFHVVSGFLCWLFAVVSFFMQNPAVYLLLSAAAILVWIIPGFILNAHFRKQNH